MSKAKKWIDPQDVEITDPMHKAFIAAEVAGETEADQGKAVQVLADQLLLSRLGLANASPIERQRVLDELHKKQREFDPDNVSLAGTRKIVNKLGAGDHAGAVRAAQDNIEHREAIRKDTKDKVGAAGRNTRIAKAAAKKNAIIKDYLKNKSQFTKKNQAYHHYAELYNISWTTVRDYLIGL